MITVLGKSFPTETERREYFRNELRRKLPELKQLEGFPIGEDEDIIALSDPPYYTACPNPWLNDFIGEWEAEKKLLENNDKRRVFFESGGPFASDVKVGKSNPIYTAHTYHTKVPHPAIMRYILHYTQPGDIVYDGFTGTGMTGVAGQLCSNPKPKLKYEIEIEFKKLGLEPPIWGPRKCVLGDLSPIATFLAYNFNTYVDIQKFEKEAKKITEELTAECSWMYETYHTDNKTKGKINYTVWSEVFLCSNCGYELVFWDLAVDEESKKMLDEFDCPNCLIKHSKKDLERNWFTKYDTSLGKTIKQVKVVPVLINYSAGNIRNNKRPTDLDLELVERIDNLEISSWFPNDRMPEGDEARRNDRTGVTHIHHFYTRRNLICLALANEKIQKSSLQNNLKFLLTGMILRSTIMNRMHMKNYFFGGGGWNVGHMKGTLYVPSIPIETSLLEQIDDKIKLFLRAKSVLNRKSDNLINVASATSHNIKPNSVDYIFTDPPFGANIMYSELNILWESWLKVLTNNKEEAIESKSQKKSIFEYNNLMTESFKGFYNILKPNKWMTVEFSNTSAAIWNSIQTAIQNAGFIIANVSALDKKQGGMRGIITATGVRQDLVISCYKPSSEFDQKFQQHQHSNVGVWDFVEEHLHHLPVHLVKDNSTTAIIERSPKILFDRLIAFYVQRSLPVPIDAGKFQLGLKERFTERDGMYFTAGQVAEYDKKKAEVPNFIQASLFVSSEQDGVLFLKNLLTSQPLTYQDIQPGWMQALAGQRKGDIIPELADILQENFLKDTDGRWYVPDPENEVDLEALRNKRLLKQFHQYIEVARQPKGKLKEARVEALRTGFKQCYRDKDFKTIVEIADCLERSRRRNLLMEDEVLLQFYDIAVSRV